MRQRGFILASGLFLFLIAGIFSTPHAEACISYSMPNVPNEADAQWKPKSKVDLYRFDSSGRPYVVRTARYYATDSGFHMGVYEYFGEVIYKAWACDAERDPVTGDTPDHMIAIWEGKEWHTRYA